MLRVSRRAWLWEVRAIGGPVRAALAVGRRQAGQISRCAAELIRGRKSIHCLMFLFHHGVHHPKGHTQRLLPPKDFHAKAAPERWLFIEKLIPPNVVKPELRRGNQTRSGSTFFQQEQRSNAQCEEPQKTKRGHGTTRHMLLLLLLLLLLLFLKGSQNRAGAVFR